MYKINLKKSFLQLLADQKDQQTESIKLDLINAVEPIILIGYNTAESHRLLYIDITNEQWTSEQIISFPQWNGVKLFQKPVKQLGKWKNKNFLVIEETDKENEEIFNLFAQSLIDNLLYQQYLSLYQQIYTVLENWHQFFKVPFVKRLTIEEQMGLFGELTYINKWLDYHPAEMPIIIQQWKGPLRNRVDFVVAQKGIEIKTLDSGKLKEEIHIANEKQLELTEALKKIYVYVTKISFADNSGVNILTLIDDIEEKLVKQAPPLAVRFKELLMEIEVGLANINYEVQDFIIEEDVVYQVNKSFPTITSQDLRSGISNVSYKVDLSHCKQNIVDTKEAFN